MISRNKISEIHKLAQKKFREESGLFIVEGRKSVADLLRSPLIIKEIYAVKGGLEKCDTSKIPAETICETVTAGELSRISCLTTPQEVLAVAECPKYDIRDMDYGSKILVLDSIRDPGNLGTIIRTADWFGIRQIVCSDDCVEFTNPKVIQATMGSFSRVKIFYDDLPVFLSNQKSKGRIYGTFMEGESIQNVDFQNDDILVIGNEANGITPAVERCVRHRIHIPAGEHNGNKAESLNAAIAAGIVMYKWCNQKSTI